MNLDIDAEPLLREVLKNGAHLPDLDALNVERQKRLATLDEAKRAALRGQRRRWLGRPKDDVAAQARSEAADIVGARAYAEAQRIVRELDALVTQLDAKLQERCRQRIRSTASSRRRRSTAPRGCRVTSAVAVRCSACCCSGGIRVAAIGRCDSARGASCAGPAASRVWVCLLRPARGTTGVHTIALIVSTTAGLGQQPLANRIGSATAVLSRYRAGFRIGQHEQPLEAAHSAMRCNLRCTVARIWPIVRSRRNNGGLEHAVPKVA